MTEASDSSPSDTGPRNISPPVEQRSRWATTVVLGDGETAFIRPLVPADQPALLAFHERQAPDSLYRRFFSPKPSLTSKELDHFTRVDMVDRVALAVEVRDEFVAWSSYERWAGRDEAEAAFMVDDEHHGRGIATLMLEHLAAIARTNGIERFTAEVLSDNRGMLAVFAKAGWPLQRRFESGVVDLDWELATTDEFIDTVERREQRADSRAVARILLPRAVAVVGASDTEGSVGSLLWRHVRSSVTVPVHPVNPRLEDLDGRRCYGSVADLPDDVSLAIIAVPTRSLESTIDACIAKRMRGAVVVTTVDSAGDHESTVIDLPALVARSRRSGLRLIGPSSMGVAGLHEEGRLQAALVEVTLPPGGVAISMQSGTLAASLLRRAADLELGVSWFVSLGDKSDVSANDLLQFWEDDQNTNVIGLYTETFGNARKFARIARRVSRTKPIVAVRTGAAADGQLGAALYKQAGLIEVPTVQALLDTCRLLDAQPVLHGPHIAVVTNSTSPGTFAVAALNRAGLSASLADTGLDWRADGDDYHRAITATLERPDIDGVMVIFAPPLPSHADAMGATVDTAAAGASKPVVAVLIGSTDGPVAPGSTVPGFAFPEQAAEALSGSFLYGRWLANEAVSGPIESRPVDPRRAAELISTLLAERVDGGADRTESSEAPASTPAVSVGVDAAVALLDSYGIAMPPTASSSHDAAADTADRLGYPVAVKARRRGRGRSAEAGIALDLADADDVTDAVATMRASLGDDADVVVVQQMIAPGIDVRVQCQHDDRLGVIVNVGYGGIDADLIDDRSSRIAPLSPASALAMLTETKVGEALKLAGFDSSPLVDVIVQAAQLGAEQRDIDELDLNPVVVSADGALVTDAAITLRDRPDGDGPLRTLD
ncbi:MAG: GNAT family N-acetyltransferase [Ilumatobacter sp.]|uniref:bifunctional acetate--CoA ligase family protein/GNAT family N-acetyltransferase n=1 Tax=Ilumatobacter sp. TaxID=1967498 RepID=UPI003299DBFA